MVAREALLLGLAASTAGALVAVPTLRPLADLLRRVGAEVTERILPGDHSFSAHRWAMVGAVLDWLGALGY